MQVDEPAALHVAHPFVEIKVLDATGVERRTAADYAVHVVSLIKQKFSQKRTVLAGDACD